MLTNILINSSKNSYNINYNVSTVATTPEIHRNNF